MKKTKRNTKIQVILIVVALILGSIFVINKIASGKTYASVCSGKHTDLKYTSDNNGHHSVTCGACDSAIAGAAPCNYGSPSQTPATCETPGSITKTCQQCGYTMNTVLPATGHDWTGWYFVDDEKKPTCQHGGVETRTCFNCPAYEERDVDAVSHDYVYKYTSNGKHAVKCRWCNRILEGTTEEECTYQTTIKENENGHNEKTNTCVYCNNAVTTIVHDFTGGGYKSLSNSRHAQKCKWCEDIWPQSVEACTYSNGKCTKCGATQPGGGEDPNPNPNPDPNPDPDDGGNTKSELSGITIYKVNDKDMTNVKINTKASELIKTIQDANEGATVTIFNSNNEAVSEDEALATGMRIEVTIGDTKYDITIVVKGDTNGDGKAELSDIIKMNKHRLNKSQLEGAYLQAADIDGDGKVNLLDIIKLNKFRLNKITEL